MPRVLVVLINKRFGRLCRKTDRLIFLSPQNLVNCTVGLSALNPATLLEYQEALSPTSSAANCEDPPSTVWNSLYTNVQGAVPSASTGSVDDSQSIPGVNDTPKTAPLQEGETLFNPDDYRLKRVKIGGGYHVFYSCPYCSKNLPDRYKWKLHINSHTGFKPFECQHCQKRYSRREKLVKHQKAVHKGLPTYGQKRC